MQFYEVWVRSNRYHGKGALTYQWPETLAIGQLVHVPLQRETVTVYVTAGVNKPSFNTKSIVDVIDLPALPEQLVQLGKWLQAYYPAPLGLVAGQLTPAISKVTPQATTYSKTLTADLPPLTSEQQQAFTAINHPDTYLLHGKTG